MEKKINKERDITSVDSLEIFLLLADPIDDCLYDGALCGICPLVNPVDIRVSREPSATASLLNQE